MTPELEKVFENWYFTTHKCDTRFDNDHRSIYYKTKDAYNYGLKATIESDQVQGLVEALEKIKNTAQEQLDLNYPGMAASPTKSVCVKALEKFRGED